MSAMPRPVLKWLQSIDLSSSINKPQWDLRNGYVMGCLLRVYHPTMVPIMTNDQSFVKAKRNWDVIKKVLKKIHIQLPDSLLDACMYGKAGAGTTLLNKLYTHFTGKTLYLSKTRLPDSFFTDLGYQISLPPHARNNIISCLRSNIRGNERNANDVNRLRMKSKHIMERHLMVEEELKKKETWRHTHIPTLPELALRLTPPSSPTPSYINLVKNIPGMVI